MGKQWKLNHLLLFMIETSFLTSGSCYMVGNNPHRHRVTLDPRGKYILEWLVNSEEKRITFNVTVETNGYVGFGLSDSGKMSGADIVIGGVMPSGKWYFSDRHAVGNQLPEEDPNQDWTLHEARESETHTFLSFSRAFDTCDPQDYPITEDKISIIWSYGQKDDGLAFAYHHRNRGVYDAYLLHPDYTLPIKYNPTTGEPLLEKFNTKENLKVWSVNTAMELPHQETSYWCTMHKAPVLTGKHHIIGLDVRLSPVIAPHAHHILLHKCNAPRGRSARQMFHPWLQHRGQECLMVVSPTGPMPTEYCTEFTQGWAIGSRPIFQPPHVGIPLGTSKDEYYVLQIHFDNPTLMTGVLVNITLDMYYTSNLRPNDGALLAVWHEAPGLTPSFLIPPSIIDPKIYGMCGGKCTGEILPPEGIKLYSILLHSHNAGKQLRLHHFRGQRELPWPLSDDNYSFNYQQWRVLTKEAHVLPGDQLVTRCLYDNTRTNGTVVGGFSTQQEMCSGFIYYYNKMSDYQQCSSQIDSPWGRERFLGIGNVTWSNKDIEYIVDTPNSLAGMSITEVSDHHVEWDLERREALQRFHLLHPHTNNCAKELYAVEGNVQHSGTNLENNPRGRLVSFPFGVIPYKPTPSCPLR